MAYTFPSESDIVGYALSHFQVAFADPVTGQTPPMGPLDFLGQSARAFAGTILSVLEAQQVSYNDAAPSVYLDSTGATQTVCSSTALDRWAYIFGLPSNKGSGQYGRNIAQTATGGGATATGTVGLVLSSGTLSDLSGQTRFTLRTGVTLTGGSAAITIDALTSGVAGNVAVGQALKWSSPPAGLTSTVTLTTALSGGLADESDGDLALRLLRFLQSAPAAGSLADWRRWTEAAQDSNGNLIGVKRAYVYKHKGGIGSVTITPTLSGSGQARKPSAGQSTAISTWLAALAIATDTAIIELPWFPGEPLSIIVTARMQPGWAQDWDDSQGTGTVYSGTSGTASLVVNVFPGLLSSAIDNGKQPRIQVALTGNPSPIPFVARCLSYVYGAGVWTITLDTALPVSAAGGETVYAGGPAVLTVAAACLAYVDSVGPSRASGYVSSADDWEDCVSISRIAQSAIDAVDAASGSKVVMYSPRVGSGSPVGVTISVSGATATSADYLLRDIGSGAQLPECSSIIVRGVAS